MQITGTCVHSPNKGNIVIWRLLVPPSPPHEQLELHEGMRRTSGSSSGPAGSQPHSPCCGNRRCQITIIIIVHANWFSMHFRVRQFAGREGSVKEMSRKGHALILNVNKKGAKGEAAVASFDSQIERARFSTSGKSRLFWHCFCSKEESHWSKERNNLLSAHLSKKFLFYANCTTLE